MLGKRVSITDPMWNNTHLMRNKTRLFFSSEYYFTLDLFIETLFPIIFLQSWWIFIKLFKMLLLPIMPISTGQSPYENQIYCFGKTDHVWFLLFWQKRSCLVSIWFPWDQCHTIYESLVYLRCYITLHYNVTLINIIVKLIDDNTASLLYYKGHPMERQWHQHFWSKLRYFRISLGRDKNKCGK